MEISKVGLFRTPEKLLTLFKLSEIEEASTGDQSSRNRRGDEEVPGSNGLDLGSSWSEKGGKRERKFQLQKMSRRKMEKGDQWRNGKVNEKLNEKRVRRICAFGLI